MRLIQGDCLEDYSGDCFFLTTISYYAILGIKED